MNIIEFIFQLIIKYVPMKQENKAKLQGEAILWYDAIRTDSLESNTTHPILRNLKKHADAWYVQTALAILFIFVARWLYDFVNPSKSGSSDEDDLLDDGF